MKGKHKCNAKYRNRDLVLARICSTTKYMTFPAHNGFLSVIFGHDISSNINRVVIG